MARAGKGERWRRAAEEEKARADMLHAQNQRLLLWLKPRMEAMQAAIGEELPLRAALEEAGRGLAAHALHARDCGATPTGEAALACTCGLHAAMTRYEAAEAALAQHLAARDARAATNEKEREEGA